LSAARTAGIPGAEHRARRDALLGRVDGPVLVRGAGAAGPSASFVYLTGVAEPAAALLAAPDGVRIGTGRANPGRDYLRGRMARQILFLPNADPMAERWGEGPAASFERADAGALGVDAVLPAASLDGVLATVLAGAPRFWYVRSTAASLSGEDDADTRFVDRVRRRFFAAALGDATPLVHEMRRVKSAAEVSAIERAGAVTARALERVLAAVRPGRSENEIEAEIAHVYRSAGATHAFDPIVACGRNATVLHYHANAAALDAGALVLVDTGARLGGYCADVTRTFPVDGRFTPRQREVYELVLEAQRAAVAACRPGATLSDVHGAAWDVLDRGGLGAAFVHGTGHHLGLDVHDPGDVHAPLEPGAVVTIEPGAYLPDEALGVRIEDDVVIERGGARILTEGIPKTVADIERAMAGVRSARG
jgi:Xaa-Pro aminopeptidase